MFPDIEDIEYTINLKADEWPGRCHEIACAVLEHCLIPGIDRYGLYHGYINPNSIFGNRSFTAHGWIELEDDSILDPTRWVFECEEPYVYHGTYDDGEYDIGGNDLKTSIRNPFPQDQRDAECYNVPDMISMGLEHVIGNNPTSVNRDQLFWLANCHPDVLGYIAKPLYNWIDESNMKCYIPIDNWKMVME